MPLTSSATGRLCSLSAHGPSEHRDAPCCGLSHPRNTNSAPWPGGRRRAVSSSNSASGATVTSCASRSHQGPPEPMPSLNYLPRRRVEGECYATSRDRPALADRGGFPPYRPYHFRDPLLRAAGARGTARPCGRTATVHARGRAPAPGDHRGAAGRVHPGRDPGTARARRPRRADPPALGPEQAD